MAIVRNSLLGLVAACAVQGGLSAQTAQQLFDNAFRAVMTGKKDEALKHLQDCLKLDMSREDVSEYQIPPHFTNIQHALRQARMLLANQNTPNRQIVLITDGLPTAHFDGSWLYLLYPPDPLTEEATMREGCLCQRDGVTINMFLVPSWSQSEEDIRFAHRLAESTKGRVFFTAGSDLDRFVLWDYVNRKREILG